ncbi:hypothetical protein BJY52DRAFT_440826 [Lactarius psammicola]|nr:hypothetical protein BJY52DRAFT_440826 [Lactarius psammicola]
MGRVFTPGMSNFPVHRNVPKSLTNKGNTIAILYGQQHNFMDGSVGFRIEDADFVQVRPILLEGDLLKDDLLSFYLVLWNDSSLSAIEFRVVSANRTVSWPVISAIRRLAFVNVAPVVTLPGTADCQVSDWSDGGHKKDCKLLNQVAVLMRQDWEHFHKYYSFPLPKVLPSRNISWKMSLSLLLCISVLVLAYFIR